jgi:hypothetical protein
MLLAVLVVVIGSNIQRKQSLFVLKSIQNAQIKYVGRMWKFSLLNIMVLTER